MPSSGLQECELKQLLELPHRQGALAAGSAAAATVGAPAADGGVVGPAVAEGRSPVVGQHDDDDDGSASKHHAASMSMPPSRAVMRQLHEAGALGTVRANRRSLQASWPFMHACALMDWVHLCPYSPLHSHAHTPPTGLMLTGTLPNAVTALPAGHSSSSGGAAGCCVQPVPPAQCRAENLAAALAAEAADVRTVSEVVLQLLAFRLAAAVPESSAGVHITKAPAAAAVPRSLRFTLAFYDAGQTVTQTCLLTQTDGGGGGGGVDTYVLVPQDKVRRPHRKSHCQPWGTKHAYMLQH
jgi:hypothetical protein